MERLKIPKTHHEKQIFWKNHYDAYLQSQMSLPDFCKSRGIVDQSFRKWIKKFQTNENSFDGTPNKMTNFIQLTPPIDEIKPSNISCRFPNGIELQWDAGISTHQIAEIIRLVGL